VNSKIINFEIRWGLNSTNLLTLAVRRAFKAASAHSRVSFGQSKICGVREGRPSSSTIGHRIIKTRENSNCSLLQWISQLISHPLGPLPAPQIGGTSRPSPFQSSQRSCATWARTSEAAAGARAWAEPRGSRSPECRGAGGQNAVAARGRQISATAARRSSERPNKTRRWPTVIERSSGAWGSTRWWGSEARAQVATDLGGVGSRARCGKLLEPAPTTAPAKHTGSARPARFSVCFLGWFLPSDKYSLQTHCCFFCFL
jgi:hypothetical protein